MHFATIFVLFTAILGQSSSQEIYETDMNFRIEPGARTCFFEKGNAGQIMEAKYQVIDGQHGDYDITFEIGDPNGVKIVSDYKQPHNSIIMELDVSGDYVFCMDNTHSVMNSKLVFVYVMIEDKPIEGGGAHEVEDKPIEGGETHEVEDKPIEGSEPNEEVLEWMGVLEDGQEYYIPVADIADSMTRTLRHVVKARHALNMYAALKTRDSYLAFEDTFIVDMWSSFQITCMFLVGMTQVYMIKKLFNRPAVSHQYSF